MAQIVQLKRNNVAGQIPTTSSLVMGELAMNTYDGRIFFKRSGSVVTIESLLSPSINNSYPIWNTGSLYLNGSVIAVNNLSVTGSIDTIGGYKYAGTNIIRADINLKNYFFTNGGNLTATGNFNISIGSGSQLNLTTGTSNINLGHTSLIDNSEGSNNLALGNGTLRFNTIGESNIAIGNDTLRTNTEGSYNIGLGLSTLYLNTFGQYNIALGYNSLYQNSEGSNNIAIGKQSLRYNTYGEYNIGLGQLSLYSNLEGFDNIALGRESLKNNTYGEYNIALGTFSSRDNTVGLYNISLGYTALQSNTNGQYNIGLGRAALRNVISGNHNIGIGYNAQSGDGDGDNNVAIGQYALFSNYGNENIAIGPNALKNNLDGSNNIVIGNNSLLNFTGGQNNTIIGPSSSINLLTGSYNTFIGKISNEPTQLSNHVIIADGQGNRRITVNNSGSVHTSGSLTVSGSGNFSSNLYITGSIGVGISPTASIHITGSGKFQIGTPDVSNTNGISFEITSNIPQIKFRNNSNYTAALRQYGYELESWNYNGNARAGLISSYIKTSTIIDENNYYNATLNSGNMTIGGYSYANTPLVVRGTSYAYPFDIADFQNSGSVNLVRILYDGRMTVAGGTDNGYGLEVTGTAKISGNLTTNITSSLLKTTAGGIITSAVAGTDYIAGGVGTANYIAKFSASGVLANSQIFDNGGFVGFNTTVNDYGGSFIFKSNSANQVVLMNDVNQQGHTRLLIKEIINSCDIDIYSYQAEANIGTVNSHPLLLRTGGTTRAKIFANGRFAINTTTDSGYQFDVNGTGRFVGALTTANMNMGGAMTISNSAYFIGSPSFGIRFNNSANTQNNFIINESTPAYFRLGINTDVALTVPNGGTGLSTLTAGYIPFGNGTGSLSSSADLFYDTVNNKLRIGVNRAGTTTLDVIGTIIQSGGGNGNGITTLSTGGNSALLTLSSTGANINIGRIGANGLLAASTDGGIIMHDGAYLGVIGSGGTLRLGSNIAANVISIGQYAGSTVVINYPTTVTSATASTSTTTGALIVSGGLGVGGTVSANVGKFFAESGNIVIYNTAGSQQCGRISREASTAGLDITADLGLLQLATGISASHIDLITNNSSTSIRLRPNSYVLVGTTTAVTSDKFQVSGNGYFSGTLTSVGNLSVSSSGYYPNIFLNGTAITANTLGFEGYDNRLYHKANSLHLMQINGTQVASFSSNGLYLGSSMFTATATLHIKAGTATANTAPFKFTTSGSVLLTTPEAGAFETDGTDLFFTNNAGVRKMVTLA